MTKAEKREATRHVVLTASIAALGGLLFGYDTGIIGSAKLFIENDFALTSSADAFITGLIVAAVPLGAIFGALASGGVSDTYGRRRTIMGAGILFIIGTAVAALAPGVEVLLVGRVLIGIAIGFASAACPVYISEVAPKELRGRLVTLFQLAVTVGILLAYIVGAIFSGSADWRAMVAVGIIPAAALAIGMARMPQSPRWLVMVGKGTEARATLEYLHPGETAAEIEEDLKDLQAGITPDTAKFRDLLSPLARVALFVGVSLAILQQITGINTVIYYAPTIFQEAGLTNATSAILAGAGVTLVNVLATIWALRLVQNHGRKTLLLVGVTGMTISLFVLGFAFRLEGPIVAIIAIVSLMVYVLSFAISLGPIFWILNSEIYPTKVRGKAAGVGSMTNWTFNFIVSLTFLLLINALGSSGTFWLYGIISVGTIFFIKAFVPETKDRSLEEIENDWRVRAGMDPLPIRKRTMPEDAVPAG
jgi:sugar porter (SP) family MFS transporter